MAREGGDKVSIIGTADVNITGPIGPDTSENSLPVVQATDEVFDVELPDAAQTSSGAVKIGTTGTKFFDGFTTWPNSNWTSSLGSNDVIAPLGTDAGVSYLSVRKCALTRNTETTILSAESFKSPLEAVLGVSWNNNIQGQYATVDFVGVDANGNVEADATPSSVQIASLVVVSNVLTVTTSTPHGYRIKNLVALSGNLDNRFNLGPVAIVNVLTPTSFTLAYTIADATYSAGGLGVVDLVCPCKGAYNSFGVALMETNDDNARLFTRGSQGPVYVADAASLGTDWRTAVIPSGYDVYGSDAINARASLSIRYTQEELLVQTKTNDNNGTPLSSGSIRTQNLTDPRKEYKLRFSVGTLKNFTRPVDLIASISKAGSTTTTVTTTQSLASLGIVNGTYVSIIGVPDQTNFVNTNNVIVTVTGANTFTCAIAGTGTATVTTGGSVFICEGSQNAPALGQAINSISRTGNVLTAVGNTNWSGMVRGEWYTLHGMSGAAASYNGTYRCINASTTSLQFASTGDDFGSITTGGSVVRNTQFRIHQVALLDFTRTLVEVLRAHNTNIDRDAINVRGNVTASATGTYEVVGDAAHDAGISGNPVRIGGRALTSNYAAVATGDNADLITTLNGVLVQRPFSIPQLEWSGTDTITNSTTATQLKAATSSNKNYVTGLSIATAALGAAMEIQLRSTPIVSTTATISSNTLVMSATYDWKVGDMVYVTASTVSGLTAGNYYYIRTVSSANLTFAATRSGGTLSISGTSVNATISKIIWLSQLQTTSIPPTHIEFNTPIDGGTNLAVEMCTPTAQTGRIDFTVTGYVAA